MTCRVRAVRDTEYSGLTPRLLRASHVSQVSAEQNWGHKKDSLKTRCIKGSHHIHTSCDFHTIFDANYVGEILIQLMWSLPLVRIYLEQEINFGLHLAFSPPMPLLALRSNLLDHLSQCHAN